MTSNHAGKKIQRILFYKVEADSPVAPHKALCNDEFDDQIKSATCEEFAGIAKPISGRVFESPLAVASERGVYYKTVTPAERGCSYCEDYGFGDKIDDRYELVGVYNVVLVFSDGKYIVFVPPENLVPFCYYHRDLLMFCSDGIHDSGEIKFQIRNHPDARSLNLDIRLFALCYKYMDVFWQSLLADLAFDCSKAVFFFFRQRLSDVFQQNTNSYEEHLIVADAVSRMGCHIPTAILTLYEQIIEDELL